MGDVLVRFATRTGSLGQIGSFESEHDLAVLVSDFLEYGSPGADSWCSSDSDSGLSDLAHRVDEILSCKQKLDQYGSDLLSVVHSLLASINETDLQFVKSTPCNASCIRYSLVKLLRRSGYDAAVCVSRWQSVGKVPGGCHEYIDVVNYNNSGLSERLIVDIDFRSHFEIARAVQSYDRILSSLPVIYVGSLTKLKKCLKVMVEAARSSLKQNSMPLPPWRSRTYLQAKWDSPYQRQTSPDNDKDGINSSMPLDHKQCSGHLKRLKSLLLSEIEEERLLRPLNGKNHQKLKFERRRHSSLRNL